MSEGGVGSTEQLVFQLVEKLEAQYEERISAEKELREKLEAVLDRTIDSQIERSDISERLKQIEDRVSELADELDEESEGEEYRASISLTTKETEEPEESGSGDEAGADSESESTDSEQEDDGPVYECYQCDDVFEVRQSFIGHIGGSKDHFGLVEFFKTEDDSLECIVCGEQPGSKEALSQHMTNKHDSTLTDVFLERREELLKRKVDGPYDVNGNIPDVHVTKKILEYSKDEVAGIVEGFLDEEAAAKRLKRVAAEKFDQVIETGSDEYQRLFQALNDSPRVLSMRDPTDGRYSVYYTDAADVGEA